MQCNQLNNARIKTPFSRNHSHNQVEWLERNNAMTDRRRTGRDLEEIMEVRK